VPSGQATALAQALLGLLSNPERADRLRKQARIRVESEYRWDRCLANYEAYYADQLATKMRS
jgi:glycosyltransferase involved in cell wall biosynthesis